MKSEFLKIAGVKSEKAFYKKFPTEAAFFKAHPEAKNLLNKKMDLGGSIAELLAADNQDQIISFDEYGTEVIDFPFMGMAKDGTVQDKGQLKKLQQLTDFGNPPKANVGDIIPIGDGVAKSAGSAAKGLGPATSYIGPALDIIGGIGTLKQEKKQLRQLKQDAKLTGVMAQAAESRPEPIKRQYVRPEDVMLQPNQIAPTYGTGTNILAAEDGAVINQISGNPTEIMNTFAPNAIYTDLGYEPLEDSSKVKNYYGGGKLTKAQLGGDFASQFATSGFGKFASNSQGGDLLTNIATRVGTGSKGPSGSSQLGKGIGAAAGTAFLGPVGGIVGGALGSLVGGLFGRKRAKQMAAYKKETSGNIDRITGQAVGQGIQNQYGSYMEDGGWVSNTWQPQVITKFGEYDVDQLLKPDPTMDTLRAGGNIRQNKMFDTDTFAMGGDLKVYRGEAEPMSVNPFLPDGGETIMFRGPSHEDGGMPIEYGDSPVEVEGGEPAVKLRNGSTGDEDLVVFGNLIEPNSKRKFKNVVADIAKKEAKQNKLVDKSINELDNLDVQTPFDKLKMSSLQANLLGGNMKLKAYADEKMDLAAKQSAINETAEELGLEADALAKGKLKKAKKGANVPKGQTGITARAFPLNEVVITDTPLSKPVLTSLIPNPFEFAKAQYSLDTSSPTSLGTAFTNARPFGGIDENAEMISQFRSQQRDPFGFGKLFNEFTPSGKSSGKSRDSDKEGKGLDTLMTIANQILPQLRPSNAQDLSLQQITPELSVMGEQPEAVYAQKFQPQLLVAYDVADPQPQLNAINMQANAAIRAIGNDPAAQAFIMGQAAELKNKAISEAQRANVVNKLNTYNQNIQMLNEAQARNLAIMDQQQVRQAQAKSATKATKLAAQQSIASKYLQNKTEQQTLQAYENLYNFRFGDKGRAQNFNPLAQFNIPQLSNYSVEELEALAKLKAAQEKKNTSTSRNGSIVKALKNL